MIIINVIKIKIRQIADTSRDKASATGANKLPKDIKARLSTKTGLIRSNLSGKRCDKTSRSVIGPNVKLHMNEIKLLMIHQYIK